MARLVMCGAEIDGAALATATQNVSPDGNKQLTGTLTRDTTIFRSGLASYKFDSTASNLSILVNAPSLGTWVDGRSYYARAYIRVPATPTTACIIMQLGGGPNEPQVRLRTDGALEFLMQNVVQGSPSAVITDSNWHRVEIGGTTVATTSWSAASLMVDGISVATWSGTQARSGQDSFVFGWCSVPGASKVMNVDDIAVNDSTGTVNNTYPGDGKIVLLVPTADSAVGTGWTNDNAAATSLFNSVKATPPAGIADTTTGGGGHQIRNATSNANVNYDATMTTYTAAGVGANDSIKAIWPVVATAAPVSTGAKAGTMGVASNPAITNINLDVTGTSGAFWAGVAAGTFGAGWKWTKGAITENPSVTKGTAPVMRLTQVTSSTRIAMCCFMGMYVEYYTPPRSLISAGSQRPQQMRQMNRWW